MSEADCMCGQPRMMGSRWCQRCSEGRAGEARELERTSKAGYRRPHVGEVVIAYGASWRVHTIGDHSCFAYADLLDTNEERIIFYKDIMEIL
jgi:hypothetical protein